MGTYTANKNLYMPTVGEQGWGDLMNTNLSTIDNFLKPITVSGSTYTFTGNQTGGTITATKITNSGTLTQTGTSTFTGKITANGGIGTKALTATSISNSGTLTQTGTSTFTGKITANGGVNDYEERIKTLEESITALETVPVLYVKSSGNYLALSRIFINGNITPTENSWVTAYTFTLRYYEGVRVRDDSKILCTFGGYANSRYPRNWRLLEDGDVVLTTGTKTSTYTTTYNCNPTSTYQYQIYAPDSVASNCTLKCEGYSDI